MSYFFISIYALNLPKLILGRGLKFYSKKSLVAHDHCLYVEGARLLFLFFDKTIVG